LEILQLGPAGGTGGKPFNNYSIPEGARVTGVNIFTEWVIDALGFDYMDADGEAGRLQPIGGLGGSYMHVELDEDEYLTGISGRYGWYVDAIRLHTNKRITNLYGGESGFHDFEFLAPEGYEITGLFGRADWYIDALGVLARPVAIREEKVMSVPVAAEAGWADAAAEEALDEGAAGMAAEREEAVLASAIEAPNEVADEANLQEEEWLSVGESEPVDAVVTVRRQVVADQAALDELEETVMAEAIAAFGTVGAQGGEPTGEGAVDITLYTQVVEDEEAGTAVATVMAVASESGSLEAVGDEPNEAAVMVTDRIQDDNDILEMEEEAVDGAITALAEDTGTVADDLDVTIYSAVGTDDRTGESYAAVVAIAAESTVPPD
jgi:hypothetical protein